LYTEWVTPIPLFGASYQIGITQNLNQQIYYQFITGYTEAFSTIYDPSLVTVAGISASLNQAATHIGFAINFEQAQEDELAKSLFAQREGSSTFFIPENKDRLKILYWRGGPYHQLPPADIEPDPNDVEEYDYEIAGYITVNEVFFVLIEKRDDTPWFNYYASGDTVYYSVEIYRPQSAPIDEIYYEFGDVKEILPGPITTRLVTHLNYGDTFLVSYQYQVPVVNDRAAKTFDVEDVLFLGHESPTLHRVDKNPMGDLGRAVYYDPEYRERYLPNTIRFSDVTLLDTSVRGASSFRGTNIFQLVDKWGPIRKLVYNQNVLLAIMSAKTQPIYVAKDRLMDLSGTSFVGRTDQIFNIADESMLDMGTLFPESVVYEQGQTFAIDILTGRI
jgi:hypothetical protein